MQPFRAPFRRLNRQSLQCVRLEVIPIVLCFFRAVANSLARRHHEQRYMVTLPLFRLQDVIRQAQKIALPLSSKSKRMQRRRRSRRKQMQRIPLGFRFEKLPNGANFHELRGFLLHLLHVLEKFHRLRLALRQTLFEVASKTQVPSKEHERINVAPDFPQIRYQPHFAVQIFHGRDRQVRPNLGRASHLWGFRDAYGGRHAKAVSRGSVVAHHCLSRRRIHQLVHQTQSGHGVFRVAHGLPVAGGNFRLREFRGKRGSAHEQRNLNARVFQIARRRHHLLRALHQ